MHQTLSIHLSLSQVLNTVFWLGKAASGCASYSGPTLNLKEFEGLLAQMKVVSEQSEKDRAERLTEKTDSGTEEAWGMDLLVSCLCWGAGETHQAGDKHIFCFCYTTATPISGRVRGDKQDMSLKKKFDF